MKNFEIINLLNNIKHFAPQLNNLKGAKLSYAIVRNTKILDDEAKLFGEILKPSEKFTEYDTKRGELCKKFAKKDAKGEFIKKNINPNNPNHYEYDIDTEDVNWKDESKILLEMYKTDIDEHIAKEKKYNDLLLEDSDIDSKLYKITVNDLSDDVDVNLMYIIQYFIKD